MLFAEETTASNLTVAGQVIIAIGMVATSLFAFLSGRDKLRFDSKMLLLEKAIADCEAERKERKESQVVMNGKLDVAENLAAKQDGELKATARELENLRGEVKDLRDRLHGVVK